MKSFMVAEKREGGEGKEQNFKFMFRHLLYNFILIFIINQNINVLNRITMNKKKKRKKKFK